MARKKGAGPAPLDPEVARKLLDLLATDNDFRRLFKKDANAALLKVGYQPGTSVSGGQCLQLQAGDRIAPNDRKSVVLGKSVSERVDLGGCSIFNIKETLATLTQRDLTIIP